MDSQPTIAKSVSRPHQYKCGVCSEEGHNSRNCPLRTSSNFGPGKARMISPTKNGAEVMVAPPPQQAPMSGFHNDAFMEHMNRGGPMDSRGRPLGADQEAFGTLGTLNPPFAHAVNNTKKRVLQCAENVATYASAVNTEDYNNAVADLVSAMDCLERVVKCAMRFSSVTEGGMDLSEKDKKRRRNDFGQN
mmetsp:Transcript_6200/g.18700  ORF Transcript_6200/g.18700 Transcript_6200/m.18700 type:complete len:190 (+) Transcript_6200:284-853(+)